MNSNPVASTTKTADAKAPSTEERWSGNLLPKSSLRRKL